ncbi:MAG TPA: DUF58 domain-containing protein [Anaeromyxobacteraceae bacterium]|nr:DUF58 domain-containing protein [Anaeromyxobacteraceae bacterium]
MDPRDLLRRVRRLELSTRRPVHGTISGRYRSVFKGRGIAFADVRPYAPGDEVRAIDWNVTARRGALHVRRFAEERELTVLLVVDVSASTDFGSAERTKREAAAEVAALVAMSAVASGDRVGLALFTSEVERYVPARRGRRHALRLLAELLRYEPRSPGTDLAAALAFLRRVQRRAATVFLLSDFAEPRADGRPDWSRPLAAAARRHDVVPVVVGDRAERAPPRTGATLLEDPETGAVVRVDLSDRRVQAAIARARAAEEAARDEAFRRIGLESVRIDAARGDVVAPLVRFFTARAARSS